MSDLTPKQQKFVEQYLIDLNATQAAIRAGYSESGARTEGSRLLANADIQDAIRVAREKLAAKAGISQERVLKEYERLAFLDIRKAFDENGNLKSVHDLDDDTAAAIAGLEVEDLYEGRGEAREHVGKLHKIKLADKKAALDSIARHLGMFTDKLKIERGYEEMTDDELAALARSKGITT